MSRDKKNRLGKIRFVLPRSIGTGASSPTPRPKTTCRPCSQHFDREQTRLWDTSRLKVDRE